MVKRQFTDKELKTIYGLLRFPTLNDRELAEVIGLNISTVTAIRRRLSKSGLLQTVNIPNAAFLGAELLTIGYGRISSSSPLDVPKELNTGIIAKDPSIFYAGFSKDYGIMMCYHKDYTDAKVSMERFETFLNNNNLFNAERWHFAIFPLELSKILNNYNHSALFKKKYEIEGIPFEAELNFEKREREHLTEKEKDVMRGLVANPTLPDKSIASLVDASRQAVSKIKKRFYRQGILQMANVLNLSQMDYEIIGLAHSKFNPNIPLTERKDGVEMMINDIPQIMMVSGNYESVMLAAFSTYQEYNEVRNDIFKVYKYKNFLQNEPTVVLLPLKDLFFLRNHDYVPMLDYLMSENTLRDE